MSRLRSLTPGRLKGICALCVAAVAVGCGERRVGPGPNTVRVYWAGDVDMTWPEVIFFTGPSAPTHDPHAMLELMRLTPKEMRDLTAVLTPLLWPGEPSDRLSWRASQQYVAVVESAGSRFFAPLGYSHATLHTLKQMMTALPAQKRQGLAGIHAWVSMYLAGLKEVDHTESTRD